MKEQNTLTSEKLSTLIANGMLEKKATDVLILDLRHVPQAIADFFVVGTGTSTTQVDAIADSVEGFVYKFTQQDPVRTEGKANKEWILLDYVDVVGHIFRKDRREFYALEDLWGDAKVTRLEESQDNTTIETK